MFHAKMVRNTMWTEKSNSQLKATERLTLSPKQLCTNVCQTIFKATTVNPREMEFSLNVLMHDLFLTLRFADMATCVAHQDNVENCMASLEGTLMAGGNANLWNTCFEHENGTRFVKQITW